MVNLVRHEMILNKRVRTMYSRNVSAINLVGDENSDPPIWDHNDDVANARVVFLIGNVKHWNLNSTRLNSTKYRFFILIF